MIRVAVVGVGHFGREHARIYASIPEARLEALCDIDERARTVSERLNVPLVSDFRELIGKVDAVSLAVPTVEHHRIACELLGAGIAVLVEKPICRTLEQAGEMIAVASRTGAVLQVGHLERFNPAVVAAGKIATTPRFFEGHRLSVFTPRSLDIDVVMDLMIHDIDVVLSLVGGEVAEIRAAGVAVITPHTDIANARIEFKNGCVANLTASRISAERIRKLRFFQPAEYVSIDYGAQEAAMISVKPGGPSGAPQFTSQLLPVQREEPLAAEIAAFLHSVASGTTPVVSGAEGRNALALALSVNEQIRINFEKNRPVTGQDRLKPG
jgi:predicted dehydrogenase